MYSVTVGDLGEVFTSENRMESLRSYAKFAADSLHNVGESAGASVAWFSDDTLLREYRPEEGFLYYDK